MSLLPEGRGSCLTFPSSARFETVKRSVQTSSLRARVSTCCRLPNSGRSSRESRDRRSSLSRARRYAMGCSLKACLHHWAFRHLKPPTALKNSFSSDWYAIASVFVYGVRWILYTVLERTSVMYVHRLFGGRNPVLLSPMDQSWLSLFFASDMRLRQWWCVILSTVIVTPRYSAWVTSRTTSSANVSGSPSFGPAQIIEHLATFQVMSFTTAHVVACLSRACRRSLDLSRSCTSSANMMTGLLLFGSSAMTLPWELVHKRIVQGRVCNGSLRHSPIEGSNCF